MDLELRCFTCMLRAVDATILFVVARDWRGPLNVADGRERTGAYHRRHRSPTRAARCLRADGSRELPAPGGAEAIENDLHEPRPPARRRTRIGLRDPAQAARDHRDVLPGQVAA